MLGFIIYYILDGIEFMEESLFYEDGILLIDMVIVIVCVFVDGFVVSSIVFVIYNVVFVGLLVFFFILLVEYNDVVNVIIDIQFDDVFVFYLDEGGDLLIFYLGGGILLIEMMMICVCGVNLEGIVFGLIFEVIYMVVNIVFGIGIGFGGVGVFDNVIVGQFENVFWFCVDVIVDVVDGEQVFIWEDCLGNGNDVYNIYVEGGNNGILNIGESQKFVFIYIVDGLNGKLVF